jgi:hypothetical protein
MQEVPATAVVGKEVGGEVGKGVVAVGKGVAAVGKRVAAVGKGVVGCDNARASQCPVGILAPGSEKAHTEPGGCFSW